MTPDYDAMTKDQRAAYDMALARIEEVRASGGTVLDLPGIRNPIFKALTTLPPQIKTLTNLLGINLRGTQVSDITPLRDLHKLILLHFDGSPITEVSSLSNLPNLASLSLSGTKVTDLRPLLTLPKLRHLWFNDTPVAAATKELTKLAQLSPDGMSEDRATQTLAYLKTLPPLPEPLPWDVPAPDEAPRHPKAALQTVFAESVLVNVPQGSDLEDEIDLRARQGWAALLDYLADFTDQRARIVNQLPALAKAFDGLQRALGDDYDAINPVQLGMQAERLIRLSKRANAMLMEDDAEDVSEFTLQLARYLPRFPVWQSYLRDAENEDAARIQQAMDDLRKMNRNFQQDTAISETVTTTYGEVLDAVESLPEDQLMALGGRTATFEILLTIAEKAKEEADTAKASGTLALYRAEVAKTRREVAAKAQVGGEIAIGLGSIGVASDVLLNNAHVIVSIANRFPEHAPYILQVLRYLGWT